MNGEASGMISGALALFIAAVLLNKAVDHAWEKGYADKYLAYFVVAGVAMVGIVAGIVGAITWIQVAKIAALFAAAGAPMMYGEARRTIQREQEQKERIRKVAE